MVSQGELFVCRVATISVTCGSGLELLSVKHVPGHGARWANMVQGYRYRDKPGTGQRAVARSTAVSAFFKAVAEGPESLLLSCRAATLS